MSTTRSSNGGGCALTYRICKKLVAFAFLVATAVSNLQGAESNPPAAGAAPANERQVTIAPVKSLRPAGQGMLGVVVADQSGVVVVSQLYAGAPAQRAGIRVGDQILAVSGLAVTTNQALIDAVSSYQPNERIELLVKRNGWTNRLSVTLGDRTIVASMRREQAAAAPVRETRSFSYSGSGGFVDTESALNMYDPYRRALYTAFGP